MPNNKYRYDEIVRRKIATMQLELVAEFGRPHGIVIVVENCEQTENFYFEMYSTISDERATHLLSRTCDELIKKNGGFKTIGSC